MKKYKNYSLFFGAVLFLQILAHTACADNTGIDEAVLTIEKVLPQGWLIVERANSGDTILNLT